MRTVSLFFLCSFYIIPELNLIYFLINKDPAPGPTGGLQPQEKDLTQALVRHHPPREARSEVVLDLLHLVIAKKDDRDHGHPKGLGLCRIRMGVFKCVIFFFFMKIWDSLGNNWIWAVTLILKVVFSLSLFYYFILKPVIVLFPPSLSNKTSSC